MTDQVQLRSPLRCAQRGTEILVSIRGKPLTRLSVFVVGVSGTALALEAGVVAAGLVSPRVLTWPAILLGAAIRFTVLRRTWMVLRHARHAPVPAWKEWGAGIVQALAAGFASTATQHLFNLIMLPV